MKVKLPFEVNRPTLFKDKRPDPPEYDTEKWLNDIKAQARANVSHGYESVRIAWTAQFNRPKYDRFEDYTPEEALLEVWEQYYFKNPDSLEMQGLSKRVHAQTRQKFYVTGDPVIDAIEEAFAKGEMPDLSVLQTQDGENIFKSNVFGKSGKLNAAVGEQAESKSEKMEQASSKVSVDNFKSNNWISDALDDDPEMKAMFEKLGVPNNA